VILGAAVLAVAVFLWHARTPSELVPAHQLTSLRIPDVTLTGDDGREHRLSDVASGGMALFFGYTNCPDTCPLTLAKLVHARKALPETMRDRIAIAFVTIDPARDSPVRLHRFAGLFGTPVDAFTGDPASLRRLYGALHVWSSQIGRGPNYAMAHTSTVFFSDNSLRVHSLHDGQDSEVDLANAFTEVAQ
jgi:protein SCO1/2